MNRQRLIITVERQHIEAALKGLYRQMGREVKELDNLSYGSLVLKYAAVIEENELTPFIGFELENLFDEQKFMSHT